MNIALPFLALLIAGLATAHFRASLKAWAIASGVALIAALLLKASVVATLIAAVLFAAVAVPLLLVTSALDEVVDPFSADAVAAGVTGPVTRLRLERSGHVATLGPECHLLVAAIVRFVATPATPRQ